MSKASKKLVALTAAFMAATILDGTSVAIAQNTTEVETSEAKVADQDQQTAILLQADEATFNATTGIYVARGNVEANYDGRTLHADELSYNQKTNQITAAGGVTLVDELGSTLHAGSVVLDGELESGLIETFGLLIGEEAKLAGRSADRRNGKTEITQAVYSPCRVCADEREGEPVWQIKALKVTHDHEKRQLPIATPTWKFWAFPSSTHPISGIPIQPSNDNPAFLSPTRGTRQILATSLKPPTTGPSRRTMT